MEFPAKSIGLCFSGGGFRASLYHLGVLRYLAEAGQLQNVSSISCVSGGTIIAALLAIKWNELKAAQFTPKALEELVQKPFLENITQKNFRNRWLWHSLLQLPSLCIPGSTYSLMNIWSKYFDRWFYGDNKITMDELPDDLDLVINTTDLYTAKAYRIAHTYHGDNGTHYERCTGDYSVRLSDAVTASASQFPKYLAFTKDEWKNQTGHWYMDGGVYDNTGLDWYLSWHSPGKSRPEWITPPEFIIVSDAAPELRDWGTSWRRFSLIPFRFLGQVFDIVQEQTRRTRKDRFIEQLQTDCISTEGIIISIDQVGCELSELDKMDDSVEKRELQAFGLPKALVNDRIKLIRTDLDNFLKAEADLLAYHSYSLMHIYLKVLQKDTLVDGHPVYMTDPPWKFDLTPEKIAFYTDELKGCDWRINSKRRWL